MSPQIKRAIISKLKYQIDRSNYGMMSTVRPDWSAEQTLNREGYALKGDEVLCHGVVVARVHRRYASRRVNLMYKELVPTLEVL